MSEKNTSRRKPDGNTVRDIVTRDEIIQQKEPNDNNISDSWKESSPNIFNSSAKYHLQYIVLNIQWTQDICT